MVIKVIGNMQFVQLEHIHPQAPHVIGFKVAHNNLKRVTLAVSRFDMTIGFAQQADRQRLVAEADSLATFNSHHL